MLFLVPGYPSAYGLAWRVIVELKLLSTESQSLVCQTAHT